MKFACRCFGHHETSSNSWAFVGLRAIIQIPFRCTCLHTALCSCNQGIREKPNIGTRKGMQHMPLDMQGKSTSCRVFELCSMQSHHV